MNELTEILSNRMEDLNKIISKCKKSLANPPKGTLRAVIIKGKARYYYRANTTDRTVKYLNSRRMITAVRLAQRDYYQTVLMTAISELEKGTYYLKFYRLSGDNGNYGFKVTPSTVSIKTL